MMRALLSQSVLALLLAAPSAAQVVVLRIDPAAESMSQQLEAALEPWGVLPDPGYLAEAQRLGLDPASDFALMRLTPPAGARLALIPRGDDARRVYVEFRDGPSGGPLGAANIPLDDGELDERGQRALAAEVRRRIGPPPTAAGEEPVSDEGEAPAAEP